MTAQKFVKHFRDSLRLLRLDRPLRMFAGRRTEDPEFASTELLYQRYVDVGYSEDPPKPTTNDQIIADQLRLPDQSVNRAKYSEPRDVLFPSWCDEGVLAFRVGDIPTPIFSSPKKGQPVEYKFRPAHMPCPDNYAHAEIHVFQGAATERMRHNKKVPPFVDKKFKEELAAKCWVVHPPMPGRRLCWFRRRLRVAEQQLLAS